MRIYFQMCIEFSPWGAGTSPGLVHKPLLGDLQKPPGQLALGGPAWAGVLDWVTSKVPFQLKPSCDGYRGPIQTRVSTLVSSCLMGHFSLPVPLAVSLTSVNSQNDICECSLVGWDHAAVSRTSLRCSSPNSAFTQCPQQQLCELPRAAEKCVWTPTQGQGYCSDTGQPQAQDVCQRALDSAGPQDD